MFGFSEYFWRLLPANPILLRVVTAAGKRKRDLVTRSLYLGLLIAVAIWSFATSGSAGSSLSLDALTAASESIFHNMSFLQLALVALLAPIFTAGAITQEKDSQTYDILLATPLTNGQIVLGSLMSRMFFIFALLLSGIPIFSITQIFGGVAIGSIVVAVFIAAATAMVTGALATAIATFKVGTRRTIFSFYMLVVIYLVGLYLLDRLEYFHVPLLDPATGKVSGEVSQTSWLTGLHPFLALQTLFPGYRSPDITSLPANLRGWPLGWYFTSPQTFYPTFMFALSAVLVLPAIGLLRRMAQSTTTLQSRIAKLIPLPASARVKKPRGVWNNPIAWREAKTKASAARASVLRYGFIMLGLLGAAAIAVLYSSEGRAPAHFISSGAYNANSRTLFVQGQKQMNYAVDDQTTIKIGEREVEPLELTGKYEARNVSSIIKSRVQTLQTIDLNRVEGRITRDQAHQFLLGSILVEVAVILLIVTNAAASTVTREREDGTLDLLLSTPLTSRYYIWGKLSGLVSFMLPLVAVPVISALIFVACDASRWLIGGDTQMEWLVLPESVIVMPATLVIIVAFATIVGMQMSLRNKTTVRAVMSSIGIVVGLIAMMGWCGNTMVEQSSNNSLATMAAAFSPISVVMLLVWPEKYGGGVFTGGDPSAILGARVGAMIVALVASGVYAGFVYMMYKSMVKNFDMTIRKQSGK